MGKINLKQSILSTCVVSLMVLGTSSALLAENKILSRLERGEVVSGKTGASFFVQALVNKEPEKVASAFVNLSKLPTVFPQIAFARPYIGSDGRQFVYLKLRGVGDGVGILAEVKNASSEAFRNAKELIVSSEVSKGRDASSETTSFTGEVNHLQLTREIDTANKSESATRFLGETSGIILEGPINSIMELPGVRMTLHLGYSSYVSVGGNKAKASKASESSDSSRQTYLVAKVVFGNQAPKESLGDYRGFGERRLSLATLMGVNAIQALRASLEKI